LEPSTLQHPRGLALYEKPAQTEREGVMICVHGTLDKARSFARVARRLSAFDVIAYDRQGYHSSRSLGPVADLDAHVDDLLEVVGLVDHRGPVSIFGHSLGGLIALSAALRAPTAMASLCVFEAPLGWLVEPHVISSEASARTPGEQAESFFRSMTSDETWDRLSDAERATRRADGPALVADLSMSRGAAPFGLSELSTLDLDVVVAIGALTENTRYAEGAAALLRALPRARRAVVEGAGHGAHLTHPDGLARILEAMARRAALERHAS
jgi:pimeloyl-ACP methyl ester carboxylesterase